MGMVEENMRVNVDESESVCGRIGMRENARMELKEVEEVRL